MRTLLRFLPFALSLALAVLPSAARAAANGSAETRVARLDALLGLSAEQKAKASEIFTAENAVFDSFGSVEDRMLKGTPARKASRKQIRAMLTPQQRAKYDISPQTLGGGLVANPDNIVAQLDQLGALTPEQKTKASQIVWDELIDQMAAIPADQDLPAFLWRQPLRDRLRALLTPEQQAKFDVTPPYRSNGDGKTSAAKR